MQQQSRRGFLKMGAIGALLASGSMATSMANGLKDVCKETVEQPEGPFYPGESEFQNNWDLTMPGTTGQVIYIRGHVLGQEKSNKMCLPLANAQVEIWQACDSGRYNNSKDPNPAKLDPNFKYWGEALTNKDGKYLFKTIIPGAYPAGGNWIRPPHIHYKITKLGYHELITQMYFAGNPYNEADLILDGVPEKDRPGLIVDFKPIETQLTTKEMVAEGLEPGALIGDFDVTILSVR